MPDTTYLNENMKIIDAIRYFQIFYADFNVQRAYQLLNDLHFAAKSKIEQPFKREQGKNYIDFGDES